MTRIIILLVLIAANITWMNSVTPTVQNNIAMGQMKNSDEAFTQWQMYKEHGPNVGWFFISGAAILLYRRELRQLRNKS